MFGSSISDPSVVGREASEGGSCEEDGAEGSRFVDPWTITLIVGVVSGSTKEEGIYDRV
jgi:hypothetical protein